MLKIATLGPAGTFSELATKKFIQHQSVLYDVHFLPTIKQAVSEIGQSCDIGIIPIENFSEGFIALVLDLLVELDLRIIDEVMLPIEFSFVSNAKHVNEIEHLFVQFVAKGQCLEFIQNLQQVNTHLTESNIESLEKCIKADDKAGAIVPSGSFSSKNFASTINKVNDYDNNQTRFLVLSKTPVSTNNSHADKTSIIVLDDDDHPGLLGEVLQSFSARRINLTNIISRPTRKMFGKYHFFIEFEGNQHDINVAAALKEIRKRNKVKMLGSYKTGTL
jgi:prephenate dehydratase